VKETIKSYSATDTERKQFTALTKRLIDIMVDFSLLTLRTVQHKKHSALTPNQIEETIDFDLQFRLQQINDPELLDIVREKATTEFMEEQSKNNFTRNK
jgi:hypothetical protein